VSPIRPLSHLSRAFARNVRNAVHNSHAKSCDGQAYVNPGSRLGGP
jgi:hypothetical protein